MAMDAPACNAGGKFNSAAYHRYLKELKEAEQRYEEACRKTETIVAYTADSTKVEITITRN